MQSTLKMPKVGDAVVNKGDTMFVVETDKAQVEVPAPAAGKIADVLIAVGDEVKTGAPVIVLDL
jgi:pyruvate/2-oxoglutarate dehydrogenase complex dihydrolipoamide acyltransferase (E2) component